VQKSAKPKKMRGQVIAKKQAVGISFVTFFQYMKQRGPPPAGKRKRKKSLYPLYWIKHMTRKGGRSLDRDARDRPGRTGKENRYL